MLGVRGRSVEEEAEAEEEELRDVFVTLALHKHCGFICIKAVNVEQ